MCQKYYYRSHTILYFTTRQLFIGTGTVPVQYVTYFSHLREREREMMDTNNDGLLPIQELDLIGGSGGRGISMNQRIEPNANALKSLCLLRDSNPVLSQKWTSNSSGSGNTSTSTSTSTTTAIDWTVLVQFDEDGNIKEMNLGGLFQLRNLTKSSIPSFSFMRQLTSLNLGGTNLDVKEDIQPILQALLSHQPAVPLKQLFLGGLGITDDDLMILSPSLQSFIQQSLDRLDLRYNSIGPNGMLHFINMFFVPSSSSSTEPTKHINQNDDNDNECNCYFLTKLYMEGNQIGNDGIMTLSKVLSNNNNNNNNNNNHYCQLKELYLGDNQIGPQGATILANALSTNKTLIKLYLEGNQIGPTGAMAFIDILETKQNTTLQNLYVDNNYLGKEIATRLAKALNHNHPRPTIGHL